MCHRNGEKADVSADHIYITMGKIDELDDTVDHRISQSYQGIHASQRNAVDELLYEMTPKVHKNHSHSKTGPHPCGPAAFLLPVHLLI